MNRKKLIRMLKDEYGAVLVKEGGKHTIYKNPRTGRILSVPRHTEVSPGVSRQLIEDAREE